MKKKNLRSRRSKESVRKTTVQESKDDVPLRRISPRKRKHFLKWKIVISMIRTL